jgi:hypothetical protein
MPGVARFQTSSDERSIHTHISCVYMYNIISSTIEEDLGLLVSQAFDTA